VHVSIRAPAAEGKDLLQLLEALHALHASQMLDTPGSRHAYRSQRLLPLRVQLSRYETTETAFKKFSTMGCKAKSGEGGLQNLSFADQAQYQLSLVTPSALNRFHVLLHEVS
jgi:hypothetical protein